MSPCSPLSDTVRAGRPGLNILRFIPDHPSFLSGSVLPPESIADGLSPMYTVHMMELRFE